MAGEALGERSVRCARHQEGAIGRIAERAGQEKLAVAMGFSWPGANELVGVLLDAADNASGAEWQGRGWKNAADARQQLLELGADGAVAPA